MHIAEKLRKNLMGDSVLNKYWKRGCDYLGVEKSILCGAMSWISEASLVSAISNEGGFGIIAGGNMPPDLLVKEIEKTRSMTDRSFGVNLVTVANEFKRQVEQVAKTNIEHVFIAGGIPSAEEIKKLKGTGKKVTCFAPTLFMAKRMIKYGADALVIEGSEAGGHVGPVSTSVLAQEILFNLSEVPVFVAGGIGTGEMMAHYIAMGAAGCQLGTRFVVADECIAHDNFKNLYIKAKAKDAVVTTRMDRSLPTIPVRAIANKGTKKFDELQLELLNKLKTKEISKQEAFEELETFWLGGLRKAAIDGDVENGSVMAGQIVGTINSVEPAKNIIDNLVEHAEETVKRFSA